MPHVGTKDEFLAAANANPSLFLGPAMVGCSVDAACLGLIVANFIYWKLFLESTDRTTIKVLVYWITAGAAAHTMMCQAYMWSIFVAGYGDFLSLLGGWWVKADCVIELVMVMPIEVFYAVRAYNLWGRNRWLKYGLWFMFIGIANVSIGPGEPIYSTSNPLFLTWVSTLFAIDWTLSILIMIALLRTKSGISHTDKMINRIILISAEAQVVPSFSTCGLLIKGLVAPTSLVVMAFIFVPKIWVITCMIVINSRQQIRVEMESERQRRQFTLNGVISTNGHIRTSVVSGPTSMRNSQSNMAPTLTFVTNPEMLADIPELELAYGSRTNSMIPSRQMSNDSVSGILTPTKEVSFFASIPRRISNGLKDEAKDDAEISFSDMLRDSP